MDFTLLAAGVCIGFAIFVTVLSAACWQGDKYLCDTCRFNDETSCQKKERPRAVTCTAFRPQ